MAKRTATLAIGVTIPLLASIAAGDAAPQAGGTATATLTVTAHVIRNCQVSATPLAFGNYDPLVANKTQPLDADGYVIVACTKGVSPTVALDSGSNPQGNVRRMTSGADLLTYEIYADTGRSTIWGSGGRAVSFGQMTPQAGGAHFLYGRLPGGQDVTPGDYTDTITVTVMF